MKNSSFVMILVTVGTIVALSFAQPREQTGGNGKDAKKDAQAQEIEALHQRVDALAVELTETHRALEAVVTYVTAQSESAQDMSEVLDDAERKGFAVGENWASRAALLAGWREQIAAAKKDLPLLTPAKKAETPPTPPAPVPAPAPKN